SSELLDNLVVDGPLRPWWRVKSSTSLNLNPIDPSQALAVITWSCLYVTLIPDIPSPRVHHPSSPIPMYSTSNYHIPSPVERPPDSRLLPS
ncbi:hypothetical protein K443DRAFT_114839, partial [Laccaria amethystina LaAM-08-1]